MKELLSRLLTPRNILPAIVILAAIIGTFDIKLFGSSVRPDQIIMALLALLAVDALIERLDLLTNIERGVKETNALLTPKASADLFFQKQDLRNVTHTIANAQLEVWIYGLTLDGLVTLIELLRQKAHEGCKIAILAPDPTGTAFTEIAKYTGSRKDALASRLEGNLEYLARRMNNWQTGSFQIKTIDRAILTGFVICDPQTRNGHLLIRPYLYWFAADGAPVIELFKDREAEWFNVYVSQFNKAWEAAEEYNPPARPAK